MNNNNTDPTPAPPLEGRGVATANEMRSSSPLEPCPNGEGQGLEA